MDGFRRGSATVLGPLLVLVAIVAGLCMGLASLSIAFSHPTSCINDRGYWCPGVLPRVVIGFGLAGLGVSAAWLVGSAGGSLWRYAWSEGPLRWRLLLPLAGGPLLAFAWVIGWLLYFGSIGAFD